MQENPSLRRSIWTSSLITLVGLAIFIAISAVLPRPQDQTGLILLGVFLAIIPAVIWLVFFYQQDRAEPEPRTLVLRMFVFGALAGAITPFLVQFTDVVVDPISSIALRLVLTIFTVALIEEALKIAMVRYVILGTNEFDEHPDGIVYGMAVGLGFASVLTITYIISQDGVLPLAGGIRAVNNALIHGALGAVGGYYIGRVKIDGKGLGWMLSGLAMVTVVNGIYKVGSAELSTGLTFNPWFSLVASVVLAVAVGAVLFYFFRRALLRSTGELNTVSMAINARSKSMPWDIHVRYDMLIVGTVVLGLLVAIASSLALTTGTNQYTGDEVDVTFAYPADWSISTREGNTVVASNVAAPGAFKPRVAVVTQKAQPSSSLDAIAYNLVTTYDENRLLFSEISRGPGPEVDGRETIQITYQYAVETSAGPVVVTGIDTFVLEGNRLYTFRYESGETSFESNRAAYTQFLNSIDLGESE